MIYRKIFSRFKTRSSFALVHNQLTTAYQPVRTAKWRQCPITAALQTDTHIPITTRAANRRLFCQ